MEINDFVQIYPKFSYPANIWPKIDDAHKIFCKVYEKEAAPLLTQPLV